ncbi:hypothetical protein TRVA0_021S01310 [Trichomonascus vanleenenianus]|uniref:uncharacterized protein n=1 Tax=Trichomonascus vanleenenianus TaxID=2268995 RepID=UPI003EC9F912
MHMRPGRLILPPHVSQFQTCGLWSCQVLNGAEAITVSGKFVTRLQLTTFDLISESITFNFPNVRSLELTASSGINDLVLERIKHLTKDLGRLVVRKGEHITLKTLAPLICKVGEEIQVVNLHPIYDVHNTEKKTKCIKDLLDLMFYPPTTPSIVLDLPFLEPELLATFIKLLVDRCPDLQSLSTSDRHWPHELVTSERYPYLTRASMAHAYGEPVRFDVNLGYIRELGSTPNCEVKRLLSDVATQWLTT